MTVSITSLKLLLLAMLPLTGLLLFGCSDGGQPGLNTQITAEEQDGSSHDGQSFPDAETAPDMGNQDSSVDLEPCPEGPVNACGGCELLTTAPGVACGPCGLDTTICDGLDAVTCSGETFGNSCLGCEPLGSEPGESCGTCGLGTWQCADDNETLLCNDDPGDDALNLCGGCEPLPTVPDTACGTCDGGTWTCSEDFNSLSCVDDPGEDGLNPCGGCEPMDAIPGDSCGPCGLDSLFCETQDTLSCTGETFANSCNGCEPLLFEPGTACGPCGLDSYTCSGTELVACSGDTPGNACGGCGSLLHELDSPCGSCGLDSYVCTDTETVSCSGDTAGNICGGCVVLDEEPGSSCGTCDSGRTACDSGLDSLSCEGDAGESALNACGGCIILLTSPGTPCGLCDTGSYECSGIDALVCIDDPLSCFIPWIAYEVSVGGLTQIEFITSDASEIIEYDSGGALIEMAPAWSPGGTKIATVVFYDGILALQTTDYTSGVVTTYINELESVATPAWSPDESRLVFAGRPEDVTENRIYRIDLATGALTQLTDPSGDDADATPLFNSDGSRIYYQRRDGPFFGGFWDIYTMNTNGAGVEQISEGAQISGRFALDPSNSFIVYPNIYYDTDGMSLFRLDLSDGESDLIGEPASTYNDPSYFPDGLSLAVTVDGETPAGSTTKNIAVIRAATGELLSVISDTVNSNSRPVVSPLDSSEISLTGIPLTFEEIFAP